MLFQFTGIITKGGLMNDDLIAYHYCSLDSLHGIISNKSFWLTSLNSTNDTKELKLGKEIVDKALIQLSEKMKQLKQNHVFYNYMDLLVKESKKINKTKQRNNKYYGLSLTKDGDSLTHWDRYANNSEGVSIKINLSKIGELFENNSIPKIFGNWLSNIEIMYEDTERINHVKDYVLEKLVYLEEKKALSLENFMREFYYILVNDANVSVKHEGFSDEKEFRVYLTEGDAEKAINLTKDELSKTSDPEKKEFFLNTSKNINSLAKELGILAECKKYVTLKHGIRSYYSLNLSEIWTSDFIQEIIIGPRSYQNPEELKEFLKCNKLSKTKVSNSKIPIR